MPDDGREVLTMEEAAAYLRIGRDKLAELMSRGPEENPLPHWRTSEVNSKHSPALFVRSHLAAWCDREVSRQMGISPLGTIRRAG
jgi:hypothetical protein